MSVRKNKAGHWVRDNYVNGRGGKRSIRVLRGVRTKKEALAAEAEWLKNNSKPLGRDNPNPLGWLVSDLAEWWIKHHLPLRSQKRTAPSARKHLVRGPLGQFRLEELTRAKLIEWRRQFMANYLTRQGKPPTGRTANHIVGMVRTAFNKAIREDKFGGVNPVDGLDNLKHTPRDIGFLTTDEALSIAQHLSDFWMDAVWFAIGTGMRRGEIWGLRRHCVDFDEGTIEVRYSNEFDTPKGVKVKKIPMGADARAILERRCADLGDDDIVFPSPVTGLRMSDETNTAAVVQRAAKKAGVTRPVHFHQLRHTFGSLLAQSGTDIAALRDLMRHSDIRTTSRYVHTDMDHLRKQQSRLKLPKLTPIKEDR